MKRKGVILVASAVGGMKNVKIFVLYLMKNVARPLDFVTLNDIVMQTDFVMYLDFAEAFHQMVDDGLIEQVGDLDGDPIYQITSKGDLVAETLHSDILSSILDKSLTAAFRYLDFKSRGISIRCSYSRRDDARFNVNCVLLEKGKEIFNITLAVDSLDRAKRMADNYRDKPEVIYRGMHALLAGNMNFLFD